MKINLLNISAAIAMLIPALNFAQAPNMGTTTQFVLYTTNGAVTNTGISQLTGNVGSNVGSSTGFGNVNGVMDDQNGASGLAYTDLLTAYGQLSNTTPTDTIAPALGGGQTLTAGVYYIQAASVLNQTLTLNALGNSNAVFIFQINGTFSTGSGAKVKLINGALACNVFWQVEGEVNMASATMMRGSVVAHNAAIHLSTNDTLEGRALSIAGEITTNGILAYTPTGCNSPVLTGPSAPALGSTSCYALLSGNGALTNTNNTHVTGDVGTNVGLTTGFNSLFVNGSIHSIPDGSTSAATADLGNVYTYLNTLAYDIKLLYPQQFGRNLVLTPHTYYLQGATALTDTLYLNAEGNANAVFVIKITGALSTSTYAKVILINQAQAKNVFWKVDGAVEINKFSQFKGTIVANNGAVSLLNGSSYEGSVFTTNGQFTTDSITVNKTSVCIPTGIASYDKKIEETLSIFPNPFSTTINVVLNSNQVSECELHIYNVLGAEVLSTTIDHQSSTFATSNLPSGIYFYRVSTNNQIIQSGKLISQQ